MTTPNFRRIFKAVVMNPVARDRVDFYDPGYLVVSGTTIQELSREDPYPRFSGAEFIDLDRQVILPGLIDTHVHLPQFAIMGIGTGELLAWLNAYTYPEEARFADPQYAARISDMFFNELLSLGTTTAVVYSSVHEEATDIAFETARAKGLRAYIGKVMMDQNSPAALQERTEDSIAASLRLFEKWDGTDAGRLRYVFTPRFAGACSMDLMKQVGRAARERGAFVQSHLSENKEEIEWVKSLFGNFPSYASIYDSAGLLGDRSIMAHCIHLSPEETDLLARSKTRVAFCPYSNRQLRSGTMPYGRLCDAGLNISLGTDVAGGPSLSMIRQMAEALDAVSSLAPGEALYLATLAGARAMGISDRVGNLDAGKDADFVVVDAGAVMSDTPHQILARLASLSDKRFITHVYLRGGRVQKM